MFQNLKLFLCMTLRSSYRNFNDISEHFFRNLLLLVLILLPKVFCRGRFAKIVLET